jgi:hypothetical protein
LALDLALGFISLVFLGLDALNGLALITLDFLVFLGMAVGIFLAFFNLGGFHFLLENLETAFLGLAPHVIFLVFLKATGLSNSSFLASPKGT